MGSGKLFTVTWTLDTWVDVIAESEEEAREAARGVTLRELHEWGCEPSVSVVPQGGEPDDDTMGVVDGELVHISDYNTAHLGDTPDSETVAARQGEGEVPDGG